MTAQTVFETSLAIASLLLVGCAAGGTDGDTSEVRGDAANSDDGLGTDTASARDDGADARPIDAGPIDAKGADAKGADAGDAPSDVVDAAGPTVASPCFRLPGKEAWNCGSDGTTLTRTIGGALETVACAHGCVPLPNGFDHQCRPRDGALTNVVNGHAMTLQETEWVHYFAFCAVPKLAGARPDRLTTTARVAWWALKEGVLDTSSPNPVGFNLCGDGGTDHKIAPLATCASGAAWQVGASGIQVPCCTLASVEGAAVKLFPGTSIAELLRGAAAEAGYPAGTTDSDGIVAATGQVRIAWLLHVTAIGFTFQEPIVTSECITGSEKWCFSADWEPSSLYAANKASATSSIDDLHGILELLAP